MARTTTSQGKRYYVDGNTVRELNPEREAERRRQQQQREAERRKRNRQNAARRNRQRTLSMSKGYMAFLASCVVLVAVVAGYYVKLQSQVTTTMRQVAALESQITDLKCDNDAKYKTIATSVDLDYIRDVAMNQLGMNYARADQIVYYSVDNSNYMNQYRDIPQ
ncbi:MAG: hypothetical protein MR356_01075 [Agathobacter sp.]|nr:hypothetical protein [Agathobacter sp.]MDY3888386.1 hypothetical protein [Agathobacter sp.]